MRSLGSQCDGWGNVCTTGMSTAAHTGCRPTASRDSLAGTLSSLEGIPVPAQEYVRDSGRNFLEDSVFFGYDYMRQLPKEQLLEFFGNAFIIFTEAYQLKYCKQIPHSESGNR